MSHVTQRFFLLLILIAIQIIGSLVHWLTQFSQENQFECIGNPQMLILVDLWNKRAARQWVVNEMKSLKCTNLRMLNVFCECDSRLNSSINTRIYSIVISAKPHQNVIIHLSNGYRLLPLSFDDIDENDGNIKCVAKPFRWSVVYHINR